MREKRVGKTTGSGHQQNVNCHIRIEYSEGSEFDKDEKSEDGEIIHKGISQRHFARSFTIAEDVKVNGAQLKDGLLTIACERILSEYKKKKLIEIK